MNEYSHLFFSIILHIFLLFTFLSIFFWAVISKLEANSLSNEINQAINKQTSKINISKSIFTDKVYDYLKAYFSGENIAKAKNNSLLLKFNITMIVLLFIIVLVTFFVRHFICHQEIDIMNIILENIIVLILVGIIEYYFFTNFASKFIPVMPSELPTVLKQKLNEQL